MNNERIAMKVCLNLESDTIFGSGHSVPGGEDIALSVDKEGFPFMKGSTFKGILREALINWLVWSKGAENAKNDISEIMGESGWTGGNERRRIQITSLHLVNKSGDPDEYVNNRVFTSIEDGLTKEKSLRIAKCIKNGCKFEGEIYFDRRDKELLRNAVETIKWVGTMRNRGFGKVKAELKDMELSGEQKQTGKTPTRILRYVIQNETPVIITNLSGSYDNSYETRKYIPGMTMRGMIMGNLVNNNRDFFEENKAILLTEKTIFTDMLPVCGHLKEFSGRSAEDNSSAILPSVKGFYEDKAGTDIKFVLQEDIENGMKRAKLGDFCQIDGSVIKYWSTETGCALRIQKGAQKSDPFQMRHISEGQCFEGYIICDSTEVLQKIRDAIGQNCWVGADKFEGFGKCHVISCDYIEKLPYSADSDDIGGDFYMVALSPLVMLDECGCDCGINCNEISKKLGVTSLEIVSSSTSVSEYGGYNNKWGCKVPASKMYDPGSVFKIRCEGTPTASGIEKIRTYGLGLRRAEGFGRVAFFPIEKFKISMKEKTGESNRKESINAETRRCKIKWIRDKAYDFTEGLSKSAIGTLQSLIEMEKNTGNCSELENYLQNRAEAKTASFSTEYKDFLEKYKKFMNVDLRKTLGAYSDNEEKINCSNETSEKISLLCELFNYSRKEGANE